MKHAWFPILIGLLIGFHIRGCVMPCKITQLHADTTIIFRDTGTHTIEQVPVPYKVTEYDSLRDTVFVLKETGFFDTSTMIADYLSTRHYSDSFGDSTYWIWLTESVSQNRIASRTLLYRNLRPTVINHYSPPEKWSMYAGAYYSQTLGVSASVIFKGWGYEVGYGTDRKLLIGIKRRVR